MNGNAPKLFSTFLETPLTNNDEDNKKKIHKFVVRTTAKLYSLVMTWCSLTKISYINPPPCPFQGTDHHMSLLHGWTTVVNGAITKKKHDWEALEAAPLNH